MASTQTMGIRLVDKSVMNMIASLETKGWSPQVFGKRVIVGYEVSGQQKIATVIWLDNNQREQREQGIIHHSVYAEAKLNLSVLHSIRFVQAVGDYGLFNEQKLVIDVVADESAVRIGFATGNSSIILTFKWK